MFELNLACIRGFGLILLTIIMGLLYNAACSKAEKTMKTVEKGNQQ